MPLSDAPMPKQRKLNGYASPVAPEPTWPGMYTFEGYSEGELQNFVGASWSTE